MNHTIAPPASWDPAPHVVVIGAGIAGLTAAHELAERGFRVEVYEPRPDERHDLLGDTSDVPPVKLGGLAASQYTVPGQENNPLGTHLRPFPHHPGIPPRPKRPVEGEHGFRFFPGYYLHIWDTLMRIPVYERAGPAPGDSWRRTDRTVFDNVNRVVTQAVTTRSGKPTLIFPRELPQSLSEMLTSFQQVMGFGFEPSDIKNFASQLIRYLVTSPERRRKEVENVSAYEFFRGFDQSEAGTVTYSEVFERQILDMPKVLAAFDSRWGDARTNITTFLQLQFQMQRRDNKADGVLNGPTTEAWFDHWYHLLRELGVTFVNQAVMSIVNRNEDVAPEPWLRAKPWLQLANGETLRPDYVVVAVDAPAAEMITADLRRTGTGGTVAQLDGFASSTPPARGPREPLDARQTARRNPFETNSLGLVPWDRFQTLTGIQYFFDTEFQLVRGHVYYTDTEWGLSSINQQGLWQRRPNLATDGYVSVLSVDIGDWNTPAQPHIDGEREVPGKPARECTPDELAEEVWRQINRSLSNPRPGVASPILPIPAWYTIDRNLIFEVRPDGTEGRAVHNHAPYLVPIVGDWDNRPGGFPWNPNESSTTWISSEAGWMRDLHQRGVWQARHGGYHVHHNSVVFAGTWTKTFTRMTSMEAACESGRHAVNAIIDHALWAASAGADRRETMEPLWKIPFGFLDQDGQVAVRIPTPLGDYCFIFDIENREPLDTRAARIEDSKACLAGKPHPYAGRSRAHHINANRRQRT